MNLFNLGRVVITRNAADYCAEAHIEPLGLLQRHAVGDFGDSGLYAEIEQTVTGEELELGPMATSDDGKLNVINIKSGDGMIMSVYTLPARDRVWIQTIQTGEETYTTILLPSDY